MSCHFYFTSRTEALKAEYQSSQEATEIWGRYTNDRPSGTPRLEGRLSGKQGVEDALGRLQAQAQY